MTKRGRKSVYETHIKPRFSDIFEWLQNGATEKQVYDNLGISKDAFYKYKAKESEFSELIKKGRESLVKQLRGALVKKALGFGYVETSEIKERDAATGEMKVAKVETKTKYAQPDVAALNLCLKNYDTDNWANDPAYLKIKQEELELKKKQAEKEDW